MKRFTSLMSAAALAVTAAVAFAAPASACSIWNPCSDSSSFEYGGGGEASNNGNGYGSLAGSNSDTTKNIYGGGDSASNGDSSANSYSGAHFGTTGDSSGLSGALWGTAKAGSEEHGKTLGNGYAATTESWGSVTRTRESNYSFGSGGDAVNNGQATGDVAWAQSTTTKNVYGGGDAVSNTNSFKPNGANAYAGSHMATSGSAGASSAGNGNQYVGSSEVGSVYGGGGTSAGRTTTYGPTPTTP
jgi:hypothetical protein